MYEIISEFNVNNWSGAHVTNFQIVSDLLEELERLWPQRWGTLSDGRDPANSMTQEPCKSPVISTKALRITGLSCSNGSSNCCIKILFAKSNWVMVFSHHKLQVAGPCPFAFRWHIGMWLAHRDIATPERESSTSGNPSSYVPLLFSSLTTSHCKHSSWKNIRLLFRTHISSTFSIH